MAKRIITIWTIVLSIVVLPNRYVGADVNHHEYDIAIQNCLVRSVIDSFADEVMDIILACSDIGEDDFDSSIFRIDYYPRYEVFEISVFDYAQGVNRAIDPGKLYPEAVFRIDEGQAQRLTEGGYSSNVGMIQMILEGGNYSDLLAEISLAQRIRYRVNRGGDVREVPLPDGISALVAEFVRRIEDAGFNVRRTHVVPSPWLELISAVHTSVGFDGLVPTRLS